MRNSGEELSLWARVVRFREPKAIVSVILVFLLGIFFLVAFGYNAKKVGKISDFGMSLSEADRLAFPAFTILTWDTNYFSSVACRHCHWQISTGTITIAILLNFL
jgi:hypothetical protein